MVLGLNSGSDSAEDLAAFMNAFQITFPVLLDANSLIGFYRQNGSASPYPLDYVIDQDGLVAYYATEYDPEAMVVVINDLLSPPISASEVPNHRALLLQASPNPFNPKTVISFFLDKAQPVSLKILDARGHLVRNLMSSELREAGPGQAQWDGKDNQGRSLSSGLFMAQIRTVSKTEVIKLTLVR